MDLEHIHEFCVLAEIGNFLEAADELDIAQSTLSRHLRSLETELGAPLFIRTTRRVKISDYGKILLPYAKALLEIKQNISNEFLQKRKATKLNISIGSIAVMVQYRITDLLADFKNTYPLYTFNVTESESAVLKEKIRDGSLDFAFVRELKESKKNEFVSLPYTRDTITAIIPAKHPLASLKNISITQLRRENLLFLKENTVLYKLCADACKSAGFTPRINYTISGGSNIISLVAKGMGIALLSRRAAATEIYPDMAIVDIVPVLETKINLIYLKNRAMSYGCRMFLDYFKERCSTDKHSE
jgi:DNA-binding transcriptional LysR family regulator